MKYFLFLSLIFVISCSSDEKKKSEVKTYSDDTNRAFEMIERGGSYYLKKAPTNTTPPPQIQSPRKAYEKVYQAPAPTPTKPRVVETPKEMPKEEIVIDENINYQETSKPAPTPPPIKEKVTATVHAKKSKRSAKEEERLIEINQNLAFYCMKHRKDARFNDDESKCMAFVNKAMNECQKSHKDVNSKLLSCIQTKLKRGR